MADRTAATPVARTESPSQASLGGADRRAPGAKKTYTEAEKTACSIEAMRNGETCEACQ